MRVNYQNVNTQKLAMELDSADIKINLFENDGGTNTWIDFADGTDMLLVQSIIDAHDPTPLPKPLSEIDQIKISQAEQFETILSLIGGM